MKDHLRHVCFAVAKGEQGATTIEYALLVFLISVIVVSTVGRIGQGLNDTFSGMLVPSASDPGGPPSLSPDDPPDVGGPASVAGG